MTRVNVEMGKKEIKIVDGVKEQIKQESGTDSRGAAVRFIIRQFIPNKKEMKE